MYNSRESMLGMMAFGVGHFENGSRGQQSRPSPVYLNLKLLGGAKTTLEADRTPLTHITAHT
jgi:hypothetical protein